MDTFVVRVWDEAPELGPGPGAISGTASRVATGETIRFRTADELVAFLAGHGAGRFGTLREAPPPGRPSAGR